VPLIDLALQIVTDIQELPVKGCQIGDNGLDSAPESRGVDANCGQELICHESVKHRIYTESANTMSSIIRHSNSI
jgi:hypothetical protein